MPEAPPPPTSLHVPRSLDLGCMDFSPTTPLRVFSLSSSNLVVLSISNVSLTRSSGLYDFFLSQTPVLSLKLQMILVNKIPWQRQTEG